MGVLPGKPYTTIRLASEPPGQMGDFMPDATATN